MLDRSGTQSLVLSEIIVRTTLKQYSTLEKVESSIIWAFRSVTGYFLLPFSALSGLDYEAVLCLAAIRQPTHWDHSKQAIVCSSVTAVAWLDLFIFLFPAPPAARPQASSVLCCCSQRREQKDTVFICCENIQTFPLLSLK